MTDSDDETSTQYDGDSESDATSSDETSTQYNGDSESDATSHAETEKSSVEGDTDDDVEKQNDNKAHDDNGGEAVVITTYTEPPAGDEFHALDGFGYGGDINDDDIDWSDVKNEATVIYTEATDAEDDTIGASDGKSHSKWHIDTTVKLAQAGIITHFDFLNGFEKGSINARVDDVCNKISSIVTAWRQQHTTTAGDNPEFDDKTRSVNTSRSFWFDDEIRSVNTSRRFYDTILKTYGTLQFYFNNRPPPWEDGNADKTRSEFDSGEARSETKSDKTRTESDSGDENKGSYIIPWWFQCFIYYSILRRLVQLSYHQLLYIPWYCQLRAQLGFSLSDTQYLVVSNVPKNVTNSFDNILTKAYLP